MPQNIKIHGGKILICRAPGAMPAKCNIFHLGFGDGCLVFCRLMESVRRAVIDVGTNSIKLLVADVAGRDVRPVHEESRQTRLGQGFYETRRLQPEAIAHTAEAVWEFAEIAREKNADSIRVIATSAARDAVNPGDLTTRHRTRVRAKAEIISGAREAEWVFQGVTTDAELARQPLLLLDVGGGSTEFILGHGAEKHFAHSFPLGTVRLMEKFPHSDPPTNARIQRLPRLGEEFSAARSPSAVGTGA